MPGGACSRAWDRKEGELPAIHPFIDLCNAASLAYAIPVAALDVAKVEWPLQVRLADGTERYLLWTHRQSGLSAVRGDTRDVLVVLEAVHPGGRADADALAAALAQAIGAAWGVTVQQARLEPQQPTISFG